MKQYYPIRVGQNIYPAWLPMNVGRGRLSQSIYPLETHWGLKILYANPNIQYFGRQAEKPHWSCTPDCHWGNWLSQARFCRVCCLIWIGGLHSFPLTSSLFLLRYWVSCYYYGLMLFLIPFLHSFFSSLSCSISFDFLYIQVTTIKKIE